MKTTTKQTKQAGLGGTKDLSRLLWPLQFLPNIGTTEFNAEEALKLAQDLGVGDSPTRFVVLNDGWFLIDLLSNILLR